MALDVGDWLSKANASNGPAGLFKIGDEDTSVPLKRREVTAKVFCDAGFCATEEKLCYVSNTDVTAVFKFPLPPRAAIHKFEARIGDRTIVTQVKKKATAQVDYDTATSQGHTAVLAKQEPGEVYSVSIGNLEALTECIITLAYVRLVDRVGSALEFSHCATWVPPYCNAQDLAQTGKVVASSPAFASKVCYSLTYDITITSAGTISSVESADGRGTVTRKEPGSWHVAVSEQQSDPSKDFQLLVECEGSLPQGKALLQEVARGGATKTVALATFVPHVESSSPAPPREVWLVVDGSGSMGGGPERQARDSALMFVKDLPTGEGIKFNLVVFGSNHQFWHPACVEYTPDTEKKAVAWINTNVNANWGGTEILGCLAAIYQVPVTAGYRREIVFLTDGGITGREESNVYELLSTGKTSCTSVPGHGWNMPAPQPSPGLLAMVKSAVSDVIRPSDATAAATAAATAIHCLGIGHGVHRSLLDGMSSRTGGVVHCVLHDEDIAAKCGALRRAATSGGRLSKARLVAKGCLAKAAPGKLPQAIFPGEPVCVLAELSHMESQGQAKLVLQAEDASGAKLEFEAPLAAAEKVPGDALAVLHAMAYIGGLLGGNSHLHVKADGSPIQSVPDEETIKEEVLRVALEEGLVTPHTSAVGVLLRPDPADPSKVSQVEVPLAVPAGRTLWQEQEQETMMQWGATSAGMGRQVRRTGEVKMTPKMAAPMMMRAAPQAGLVGSMMSMFRAAPSRAAFKRYAAQPPLVAACMAAPPPSPGPGFAACMAPAPAAAPAPAPQAAAPLAYGQQQQQQLAAWCSNAAPMTGILTQMGPGAASMDMSACVTAADREYSEESESCATDEGIAAEPAFDARNAVQQLNMLRDSEGCWQLTEQLQQLLVRPLPADQRPEAVAKLPTSRPASLSDAQWATVLALAFLRKHCSAVKGLWEGMESKALAWLQASWPQGLKGAASTVIGMAKVL